MAHLSFSLSCLLPSALSLFRTYFSPLNSPILYYTGRMQIICKREYDFVLTANAYDAKICELLVKLYATLQSFLPINWEPCTFRETPAISILLIFIFSPCIFQHLPSVNSVKTPWNNATVTLLWSCLLYVPETFVIVPVRSVKVVKVINENYYNFYYILFLY